MANTPGGGIGASTYSGYFSVVAWILTMLLFLLLSRLKIGYTLLFFFCIASIIVVLAIGSPTIVSIFNAASNQGQVS